MRPATTPCRSRSAHASRRRHRTRPSGQGCQRGVCQSGTACSIMATINCVGWALAMYFCAWEGGRLVTSTEYEYLSRWHHSTAPEGRTYVWGESAPDCARVHYGPCPGSDGLLTRPVGSLSAGAIDAIYDLAGNVADYVADDFAAYSLLGSSPCWTRSSLDPLCLPSLAANHFARGSSHMNSSDLILRTVFRPISATSDAAPSRGFRCAYPVR